MLDGIKLNVTVDVPEFLMGAGISNVEEMYSSLATYWIEYSEDNWVSLFTDSLWEDCNDERDEVSKRNHIAEQVKKYSDEIEKHFEIVCQGITGQHFPNQINVKPTGLRGVVLWATE